MLAHTPHTRARSFDEQSKPQVQGMSQNGSTSDFAKQVKEEGIL